MYYKKISVSFILGCLLVTQQVVAEEQPKVLGGFESENDVESYAIGASVGRNFKKDGFVVNYKAFTQGLDDGSSAAKLKVTEKEFKGVLADVQAKMRLKMAANHKDRSMQNRKKEEDFLKENAKKKDVVILPSGVQYEVLKKGEGLKPKESDIVEVNYRGTLLDGTEFDASLPEKPAHLKLVQLIAGWKEAMRLMPSGSKWKLFIPAKSAYGERGVGTDIGPNEMLIFEVELLGDKKIS